MINLNFLPPSDRSVALREIRMHFFAVVISLVVAWSAMVLIFIGLGWIFFRIQNGALMQHLSVEQSTDTVQQTKTFESAEEKTNARLAYAAAIGKEPRDDDAFLVVLVNSLVPQGVHLHSLVINSVSGMLTIGGTADTRDEFLALQQRLENQKDYFAGVQSPLSNLLNPDHVSFSFLITLQR